MRHTMSKWALMSALCQDGCNWITFTDSTGKEHKGIVAAVEREDGSGQSFNVTFNRLPDNVKETIHVYVD